MFAIRPFVPLLVAAGILLAGNGLFSTLIAIRGAQEGMSAAQIGWMGTTNFIGFLAGCIFIPRVLQSVGHIRTFAALASLASGATLMMVLVVDPYMWMAMRLVTGLCFAGLFTTIESWLNTGIRNEVRGQILSIYRILDITVVAGAQFMMPLFGTEGFTLFGIMALMISFSLIPVALGDRSSPKPPAVVKFDIPQIWAISPLACTGCIAIGMTNSAFRFVGPLYAEAIGLTLASIATFISLGIIGGAVLQYPLGMLSDKYDRRWVLVGTSVGAFLAGLFLAFFTGGNTTLVYIGIFLFGAFSLPLYSISAAHANDRANPDQYVLLAAGLMFFYGVGAMAGPPVSSFLLGLFGPSSLFTFTCVVHWVLVFATLWRMRVRESVPQERRGVFRMLIRTSPFMHKMTRKSGQDKTH